MQVPERLALIGGSILLSSTLIFTLKSQASTIIPNVSHSISSVFDHIGDAQKSSDFDNDYQQAQKKGWQTGNWGSAPYYIDDHQNMYIGKGTINGILNLSIPSSSSLHSINFEKPVKAPQNTDSLFQANSDNNHTLKSINGLERMDTSQVTNMDSWFANDTALTNLDLSNWDVSKVTNMHSTFWQDTSLKSLNLEGWNTQSLNYAGEIFCGDISLEYLNIKSFNNKNANMTDAFAGFNGWSDDKLNTLVLGNNSYLTNTIGFPGTWKNGDQTLSNTDLLFSGFGSNPAHPGTWIKQ